MLEEIKEFYCSMTTDELTEYLKSIGLNFKEVTMEQQYYNLVFVKHENSNINYLFQVPMNIRLKAGEKVFVNTIQGEQLGTCVSDSFIVGEFETACIMAGTGAYYPLKEVVGYAYKQEGYRCVSFDVPF